jgi:hypothetical protein
VRSDGRRVVYTEELTPSYERVTLSTHRVQLRGQGTLYREGHRVATVRYDLWFLGELSEGGGAAFVLDWHGTVEIISGGTAMRGRESLWLHLQDDAHWLAVRPAGRYPLYLVRGTTSLQSAPPPHWPTTIA